MNKKQKKPEDKLPGSAPWLASYADMVTILMAFFILLFAMSVVDQDLFEQFMASFNPARAAEFSIIDTGAGGDLMIDAGLGIMPEQEPPPLPIPGIGDEDDEGAAGETGGEEDEGGLGGIDAEGDTIGDMMSTFRTYMAQHHYWDDNETGIVVDQGENFLRITLPADQYGLLFNSGAIDLLPAAINALDALGPILAEFAAAGSGIIVEGHTDNVPMSAGNPFRTNTILSGGRAGMVVDFLKENWGINPELIAGVGRGEDFPIADNATPEGRALNRRVEIKVFTAEVTGGAIGSWWMIPRDDN